MIRKLIYDLLAPRHCRRALRQLRWLEQKLPTPQLRLAVPIAFHGQGHFKSMKIMQHGGEILELYERVLRERPRRVLEIGTARGGSLYLWGQAAEEDATIISLDLPGGPFGGGYPACRAPFYRAFARPGQRLELLRGNSFDQHTRGRVVELLDGEPLDFLFIDADHTFEGVSRNYQLYAPLVRPGGLIGFHDILPNPRDERIAVWKLWQQLRERMPWETKEIVGSPEEGRPLGIGLLRVPEAGIDAAGLRLDAPQGRESSRSGLPAADGPSSIQAESTALAMSNRQ